MGTKNSGRKKTREQWCRDFRRVHGDKYSYALFEPVNARTKAKILCLEHGFFEMTPCNHMNGKGCRKCANERKSKNLSLPKEGNSLFDKYPDLSKEWDDDNILSPTDVNCGTKRKAKWICHVCCNRWEATISNRTSGKNGCPECKRIKTGIRSATPKKGDSLFAKQQNLSQEWDYERNYPITPKCVFSKSGKKVHWICRTCSRRWEATILNRTSQENGCPHCSNSKGENKVYDFLDKVSVIFKSQYSNKECKHIHSLRFDFAILDEGKHVLGLIEFHGQQHYIDNTHWDKKETREVRLKRDQIKADYCKQNNIPFLVIHYKDEDKIEEIVGKFLEEIGAIKKAS